MENDFFHHPRRFPKNADGPFYTTGYPTRETNEAGSPLVWCGDCLQCEAPESEAPELLAPLVDENIDTYFVKQPTTSDEIANACNAARVCCVAALRYGGRDRFVIRQLQNNPEFCDYVIDDQGHLVLAVADDGDLLPFAKRIVKNRRAKWIREQRRRNKKWWQFWL